MKSITLGIFGLFLACVLMAIPASAQTVGGTIHGTVTDSQGLAIASAKVTITNQNSGSSVTINTNSAGIYNYLDLLVGTYSVTVEKDGFEKLVRPGIQIFADQTIEVPVTLTLGSVSTTIEVTSGAPLVQSTTSQLSHDWDATQVTELPNTDPGGSPLSLALLAPNSTGQTSGLLGEGGAIGGMRPRFNSFTIDGADDNRQDVNGHSQDVIPESVAEFNLLTNQFSAEYGHSAGGQFNTITKSGTNNWNGDAWLYNQNRNYDAMDNLNHQAGLGQPPRFDYNRFGADAGGAIIKNRLFIYGAYAQRIEGLATQAVQQSAPTAAGLATLKAISDPAVNTILDQFPTAAAQGTDPKTGLPQTQAVTVPGGACAAGCDVPFGPIFPIAPNYQNWWDFIINADLTWGKHADSFHVLYDRSRLPWVNGDTPQAQFTGAEAVDARKYIYKDTWILSDRFVNDFRASYSRFVLGLTVPPAFANYPNAEVDNVGLDVGPQGCAPQGNIINTYQLVDNMSYVRGKHTFKWGAEWTNWISPGTFLPRARGEWDYANINELANDIVPTGINGALRGAGNGEFPSNANGLGLYIQDDWKVTSKLTLNLGLRYEWNGVLKGDALQNLNSISDLPGVFTFGTPKADWNNWGPRIGLAYDPFGNGKWAIRAGFAVSYDVTPTNFPSISLPPQLQTEQNPQITCNAPTPPSWCADFNAGGPGTGFLQGGGLLQINVPCTNQADCRASTGSTIVNVVEPKILTYTLGVQHDVGWNSSIEVRYLGTRGLELPIQARLNTQTGFDAGLGALPTYFSAGSIPATVTPTTTLANWDAFENNSATCPAGQPSPFINGAAGFCGSLVTGFPPLGSSSYNALSVDFNHRVGHGLSLRANYTYSRTIDNITNELNSSKVNPRRALDWQHLDKGVSALDVPQRLAVSWVYEIPGYHGDSSILRAASSGWEYAGTWLAAKGTPVTILNNSDANGNLDSAGDRPFINPTASGTFNSATQTDFVCNDGPGGATRIVPLAAQDPNTGVIPCGTSNDANVVGYVAEDPTAKYVFAQLGSKTNLKVNTFRSPGINTFDMNFSKTTKLTERFSLQFSVAMYDIFNHRSYSLTQPSVFQQTVVNATSTTYSSIGASPELGGSGFLDPTQFSGGSRSIQFGLKLKF